MFEKVLVATDYSEAASAALQYGEYLALRYGAQLHVVHVQADALSVNGVVGWPVSMELTPEQRKAVTDKLVASVSGLACSAATTVLWSESPPAAIRDYAQTHGVDLLVLGSHCRTGIQRFFLGSVAAEVVRLADVSALVVGQQHGRPTDGFRHIFVGVDFSPESVAALRAAERMATAGQTRITAIHVFDNTTLSPYYLYRAEQDDRDWAREQFDKMFANEGFSQDIETLVAMGRPHTQIVEHARESDVDLIVMGSRGLGVLQRMLLGSVTERVLRSAPCAVLVHRDATEGSHSE